MSSKQAAKGALSLTPVFVLVAICCVSGALLGGVHMMTAPIIAAAEEQRAQETYAALVPEAASFEELCLRDRGLHGRAAGAGRLGREDRIHRRGAVQGIRRAGAHRRGV